MDLPKEAYLHMREDMKNIQPGRSVQENVISHAQADMRNIIPAPPAQARAQGERPSVMERFVAWRAENVANRPKLQDQIFPMFREMVKDIRQTFNEVMLGHHEHSPEPGAPMNPTQIMVTDELRPGTFNHESTQQEIASYEHESPRPPGPDRDHARGHDR